MTDVQTNAPARPRQVNPECAAMFNLVLPNGVRLGDASIADMEAANLPYAEASSNKGRLVREILALARKFEAGAFQG